MISLKKRQSGDYWNVLEERKRSSMSRIMGSFSTKDEAEYEAKELSKMASRVAGYNLGDSDFLTKERIRDARRVKSFFVIKNNPKSPAHYDEKDVAKRVKVKKEY